MCDRIIKSRTFLVTNRLFQAENALDLAGGAYDAAPSPIVSWGGGYPLPIPSPFGSFAPSNSALLPL